jgi:hypothetical protein
MAFVFADRVKEQSASLGLGNFILTGALAAFRTFSAGWGDTNSGYYTIVNEDNTWEVGVGTINGATLTRDTVLSSSNGGSPVNFALGTKTVFSSDVSQLHANTLTESIHALLDHQVGVLGVPAPEAFTQVAHDAFDHSAQLGVPAPEAFDQPAHALEDHTGLIGIGDVGPSSPTQWGLNRVSAPATFNLTGSTDGIHFLSMEAGGTNLGVLSCNVATAPNDDYPFMVIFNEDTNSKGAVINVFGVASVPLITLAPREGCRLWHTGATTNEYQVERIIPQNSASSEILRLFFGNTLAANTWFSKWFIAPSGTTTPLDPTTHNWPILSPTRLMALSWRSSNGGGAPTTVAVLDEAEVSLQSPVLPIGQDGVAALNAAINPVAGAPSQTTKALNFKFISGGDKADTSYAVYGFSRDGGVELHYRSNSAADANFDLQNGGSGPTSFSPVNLSERRQTCPIDATIDRITLLTEGSVTFDLEVQINGTVADTIVGISTTADAALLLNLGSSIPVPGGAALSFSVVNGPTLAPFIGELHLTVRLKGIPGFVIPFGGELNTLGHGLKLGKWAGLVSSPASGAPDASFVCPVDLRILGIGWLTENGGGEQVQIEKDGVSVFTSDDNIGAGLGQYQETPGLSFLAGERLEVSAATFGFSNDSSHALIHATAIQSTGGVSGGGGGGGGGGGSGLYLQRKYTTTSAGFNAANSPVTPHVNTKPQDTQGIQLMTLNITPSGVGTKMVCRAYVNFSTNGNFVTTVSIFNNKSPDALATRPYHGDVNFLPSYNDTTTLEVEYETVDLLPLVFQVRISPNVGGGALWVNRNEVGVQQYDGTQQIWFEIVEVAS